MGPKRLIGCSPSAWSSDVLGSSKPKKERKKERNTDVLLLNYAVGLEVARVGSRAPGLNFFLCCKRYAQHTVSFLNTIDRVTLFC